MRLLTSYDITDLCSKYNIQINGIHCRDDLPEHLHDGWYILNLDRESGTGTHWTCFRVTANGLSLYFDSFGFIPPKELSKKLGYYSYNGKKIQSLNTDSCGWWCLACIKYCEERANQTEAFGKFISLFKNKPNYNEKWLERYFNC